MVHHAGQLRIAHALDADFARALLHRVAGVGDGQAACRFGDDAKKALHQRQGFGHIELAGNDENCIVRLVILAVKGLQVFNAHVFDIAARTNGGLAVVVPVISRGRHVLPQCAPGVVLAHFHFIAHHGKLGLQIFARDKAVNHAVRFHLQRPLQVVVVSGKGFEVIGTVVGRSAVKAHAAFAQFLHDVAARGRALEHQMLQQMRHAGFAIVFMPAAH